MPPQKLRSGAGARATTKAKSGRSVGGASSSSARKQLKRDGKTLSKAAAGVVCSVVEGLWKLPRDVLERVAQAAIEANGEAAQAAMLLAVPALAKVNADAKAKSARKLHCTRCHADYDPGDPRGCDVDEHDENSIVVSERVHVCAHSDSFHPLWPLCGSVLQPSSTVAVVWQRVAAFIHCGRCVAACCSLHPLWPLCGSVLQLSPTCGRCVAAWCSFHPLWPLCGSVLQLSSVAACCTCSRPHARRSE
jgi:hypothetical protein